MQNFNLYSLNELMLKNDFSPTEVFYTKYKNKEKNICAIFEKKKLNKNNNENLKKILKKSITLKKSKKIYNPGNNKIIKINVDKINDLSLTYKPTDKIHQNILDNILERKIKYNQDIKKYEVYGNKLKNKKKLISKNNYEKYFDNECNKINNFLNKINND